MPKDEYELTRDSFLEKIAIISVGYFCVSTEMWFLFQLKEFDNTEKVLESEYWHTKSLEMVCKFLPSECPLLNHIMIGYSKHHSPIQYTIHEEQEFGDHLRVI